MPAASWEQYTARTAVERLYVAVDYTFVVHELQALCKLLKAKTHPASISIRIVSAIVGVQSLGLHDEHEVALSTRHHNAVKHVIETKLRGGFAPAELARFLCGVVIGT